MIKKEFVVTLRRRLKKFSKQEVEERISFYTEIIDDNIEEGLTEEEAISKIGTIDKIVENIESEIQLTKIDSGNAMPKQSSARGLEVWKIVLLILGAPIWFSLLVGLFACVLSVYASLWAVAITFWGIAIGFVVGGPIGALLGVLFIFIKSGAEGLAMVGAGLVLAGLGLVFIYIAKLLTKLLTNLTWVLIIAIKKVFVREGE